MPHKFHCMKPCYMGDTPDVRHWHPICETLSEMPVLKKGFYMPAEEIKPCPFCGCMPEYVGNGYGTSYMCVNDDCATSGSWSFKGEDAKERALGLWNRRADTKEKTGTSPNSSTTPASKQASAD